MEQPILNIEFCRDCGLEFSECEGCSNYFCEECTEVENYCVDCAEDIDG